VATEDCQFVRRCQRCRCPRHFRCANKFRVNANGKSIDVWLLFDCCSCGATAKLPVLERVAVSRIGRERLQAFETNDPDEVTAAASDVALLRRAEFTTRRLA
jgi:hypothetical protein